MIHEVTEASLVDIHNAVLRKYAGKYVQIYQDFIQQISQLGLEIEEKQAQADFAKQATSLKSKGAVVRNSDKSIFVNRISPACQACRTGEGSTTYFISLKCHRDCFFCFNPNQQDYAYFRTHQRETLAELDEAFASGQRLEHVALTGGEPLLYKPETYAFFRHARQLNPGVFTRLYTSGDHIDPNTLEELRASGLDEIRFSIRMHDLSRGHRKTYEAIALARDFIPNVMVEMPVLPGTLAEMQTVLVELERLEIFGINLLEFCFPIHNAEIYREKGYRIKNRPYRVLYDYWYAGGLPIAGSEPVCLDLLDFALSQELKLGVHYCSLENKHTGQLHHQNSGHAIPRRMYFSQNDFFIKTAKVFGADIAQVRRVFDKGGVSDYVVSEQDNSLEFHLKEIARLKKLRVEIGIASYVIETRGSDQVLRELKVDVTTPQSFRFSTDA